MAVTIIDVRKRVQITYEFALLKLLKEAKKKGVRIADISFDIDEDRNDIGYINIETDCPEWVADTLGDYIRISNYGKVRKQSVHPGKYDWASDTYFKDYASVEFSI